MINISLMSFKIISFRINFLMSNIKELIKFESVSIKRGDTIVLENIDFILYNSEIVFLTGDSGSGKSTFLKSLYGAIDISEGHAHILNYDLNTITTKQLQFLRRKLGLVFQDFKIFDRLSVFENLNYFLNSINFKDAATRKKLVLEMCGKVGISEILNNKGHELSGGEKQRLSIARALIHRPEIIIADEPTGNLHRNLGVEIFSLLRDLAIEQGTSVLTSTHDESLAKLFSSRTYECKDKGIKRN